MGEEMITLKKMSTMDKAKLGLLFLVPFLLFIQTTRFDYALDDSLYISQNDFTQEGFSGIYEHLTNEALTGFYGEQRNILTGGRYRPLALITYAIEHQIFGLNPGFSHFINACLYGLLCALLYFLIIQLGLGTRSWNDPLLFGLLLFAVHPLHVEVVANIKGRDQIMGLIFSVLCALAAWRYLKGQNKFLGLAALWFFLALLSKESSITMLLPIPLLFYFLKDYDRKKIAFVFGALSATAILWFFMRTAVIQGFESIESTTVLNDPFLNTSFPEKLGTLFYTWILYIKLLVFPNPLTHDYYPFHIPIVSMTHWASLLSILFHGALAALAIWGLVKRRMYAFFIILYASTFSISSNLFFNIGTFMNERFMFEPSLAFCIPVGIGLSYILKKNSGYVVAGICLLFAIHSFNRSQVWKDNYTLFTTDAKTSKNSVKVLMAAGGETLKQAKATADPMQKKDLLKKAISYLEQGISLLPSELNNYRILGNAWIELNGIDENVVLAYNEVLKQRPEDEIIHKNIRIILGNKVYSLDKRTAFAKSFHKYLSGHAWYYFELAKLNNSAGKASSQTLQYLKQAVALDPENIQYRFATALELGANQEYDMSNKYLLKIVSEDATNKEAIQALAANYFKLNMPDSVAFYEARL